MYSDGAMPMPVAIDRRHFHDLSQGARAVPADAAVAPGATPLPALDGNETRIVEFGN